MTDKEQMEYMLSRKIPTMSVYSIMDIWNDCCKDTKTGIPIYEMTAENLAMVLGDNVIEAMQKILHGEFYTDYAFFAIVDDEIITFSEVSDSPIDIADLIEYVLLNYNEQEIEDKFGIFIERI